MLFGCCKPPTRATLVPCHEESVNFDTTGNIFIEGDNFEVLNLLHKSYFGQVKMIYIDPPYNTGNDFVYPDNYADPLDAFYSLPDKRTATEIALRARLKRLVVYIQPG